MRIRDACPGDGELITRFNALLAQETEDRRPDEAVLRRGVERALGKPEMCRYFVAEGSGGEPVGQTMVTYEWSDWRDGVVWWLQSVYVVPEARGRGVFRALFEHIRALARTDPDVIGLRLYVETENERAQRVYEKLGMRRTGYFVLEDDWSRAFG